MKIVEIEIPKETVDLEKSRPPETMCYDDFIWCIGSVFSFMAKSLVVDAAFFGFLRKLLEAFKTVRNTGQPFLMNDENGAYQINVSVEEKMIHMRDAFGNGSASVPTEQLLESVKAEFFRATTELEDKIPNLLMNPDYKKMKAEIETSIRALKA